MTCIVGLAEEGKVYIGGDSAGVAGYDLTIRADSKVFTNGEFLMGFTSSFRMGQLLRYSFSPPPFIEKEDLDKYMVTRFVDALRTCLQAGGYEINKSGRVEGGTFLVGVRGRLYVIEGDYQVGIPADNFAAVGCGDQIAHGALYASQGQDPEKRLEIALRAAEHFSGGVRAPFKIING